MSGWLVLSNDVPYNVPSGYLAVTCWCEAAYAFVPEAEILAGRTISCGHWRCHPPQDA